MHGAASVLGAFEAAVRVGVPYELHAITAAAENMVSGKAYRLGDVLRASNGTTIEINNTDAEGRLTLADALVYAGQLEPDVIIDLATLTGACLVALGPQIAGLMTQDDALADRLLDAAEAVGEDLWRLPLPGHLEYMLESKIADCRNTGERAGGALTAGLFLQRFVPEKVRWAHIDIAGPAMADKPYDIHHTQGTGYGVALLVQALATGSL
jgi:leucyl aminopeptidase